MEALESMILKLTHETPSGGICRVGPVSFRVWYCSDIWEWEYQGETYWDTQDLADAIVRDHRAALQQDLSLANKILAKERTSRAKRTLMVDQEPADTRVTLMFPVRAVAARGNVPRLSMNTRNLRASRGRVTRSSCATDCPCATPCAKGQSRQGVLA